FTSRAEFRLLLRADNADFRLTPIGREMGLVDDERWAFFCAKREATSAEVARLDAAVLHPHQIAAQRAIEVLGAPLSREPDGFDLLRRPVVSYASLTALEPIGRAEWMDAVDADERLVEQGQLQVEVQAKHSGHSDRQQEEIECQRRHETLRLPDDLDYGEVRGLSSEVRQRLKEVRPATIGQAARVPGVTPAAVSLLLVHLKRKPTSTRATA